MMTVYLCGPINGRSDADCKDWRATAAGVLTAAGYAVLDPMARDYRGVEDTAFRKIVEGDKADIAQCDVLLVYFDKPSVGTSMEVFLAWTLGKPVVVVDVSGKPLSPWMRYHATLVCSDLAKALAHFTGAA